MLTYTTSTVLTTVYATVTSPVATATAMVYATVPTTVFTTTAGTTTQWITTTATTSATTTVYITTTLRWGYLARDGATGAIYYIYGGAKHRFASWDTYTGYGFGPEDIRWVNRFCEALGRKDRKKP